MPETPAFEYDVFLSHSAKDKDTVREIAERLRADGLRVWFDEWVIQPGANIPVAIERGLEQSRTLVLFMSEHAFGSDWATLESQTFRFRDPLNEELRFLPIRLDSVEPRGTLAQFRYLDWRTDRSTKYLQLMEGCRSGNYKNEINKIEKSNIEGLSETFRGHKDDILSVSWNRDSRRFISGSMDGTVKLWDLKLSKPLHTLVVETGGIRCVSLSRDGSRALCGCSDWSIRLWGKSIDIFRGHMNVVNSVAWSPSGKYAASGSEDGFVKVWDINKGLNILEFYNDDNSVLSVSWGISDDMIVFGSDDGSIHIKNIKNNSRSINYDVHSLSVNSVAWSPDGRFIASGSNDGTVHIWEILTRRTIHSMRGHMGAVKDVCWSPDGKWIISGSADSTVRIWNVVSGRTVHVLEGHVGMVNSVDFSLNSQRIVSGSGDGTVRVWNMWHLNLLGVNELSSTKINYKKRSNNDDILYTNAKVLLVGDTSTGKTGLAHRLATGQWKPSDGSTVGAWATQWKLDVTADADIKREVWLWDFGGQADQRLVHQLYMDRAALVLLLFDASKDEVLGGLRDWLTALRRTIPDSTPVFLIAGRIDAGFKASRGKIEAFAEEHGLRFLTTSAMDGTGCDDLRSAIDATIDWADETKRTSPRLFQQIREEILAVRDDGQVLHTFKELRRDLVDRMPPGDAGFDDATLRTVIGLLDGPGAVRELDFGTYVLLQPDWINAYAQAVLRTLRDDERELGSLPLRSIAEGELIFQHVGHEGEVTEMKRLSHAQERVVLGEMERVLIERGLCLRQGDKLVFPSHVGRERPDQPREKQLPVAVRYTVQGYLDDLYATLVVKLADGGAFALADLWRDAADFATLAGGKRVGVRLLRETASYGTIDLYFDAGVSEDQQVVFAHFIHDHLDGRADEVQRLRAYVCPKCGSPKGNPEVLRKRLVQDGKDAKVPCDLCDMPIPLWDALEQRFADETLRTEVEGMKAKYQARLDSRRKGKLLALEVGARIASADQKSFEIPGTEDEGIDVELEFTDDDGKGTGQRLYLQLKSGNSHLKKRKDGTEVFKVKDPRWVDYWLKQKEPVMLVIGTFPDDEHRLLGKDRREFESVRWMRIDNVLREKSEGGTKRVTQIDFTGERMDIESIRRWRDEMLGGSAP